MDKRGGQEAVKGLGLRKIFCIPESMVVLEGSSPESGLGGFPETIRVSCKL